MTPQQRYAAVADIFTAINDAASREIKLQTLAYDLTLEDRKVIMKNVDYLIKDLGIAHYVDISDYKLPLREQKGE